MATLAGWTDAFDYLDQAIAARDPALVYLAIAPHWDSLRGDSRFSQRLARLALPRHEANYWMADVLKGARFGESDR